MAGWYLCDGRLEPSYSLITYEVFHFLMIVSRTFLLVTTSIACLLGIIYLALFTAAPRLLDLPKTPAITPPSPNMTVRATNFTPEYVSLGAVVIVVPNLPDASIGFS